MTKADTIPQGSLGKQQRWCDILEGRQHSTKHGYFCTRLPDDSEREAGITPAAARQKEDAFFDSREPWATSTRRDRCGTQALVKYLSELLTQRIRDSYVASPSSIRVHTDRHTSRSLPKIRLDVETQLQDCKKKLDALPQAIASEPCSFVNGLLMDFCDDIKAHVRGSPTSAALVQANKRTYQDLKTDIRGTAPTFVPFEPADVFSPALASFKVKHIEGFMKPLLYLKDVRERIARYVIVIASLLLLNNHVRLTGNLSVTSPGSFRTMFRMRRRCRSSSTSSAPGNSPRCAASQAYRRPLTSS